MEKEMMEAYLKSIQESLIVISEKIAAQTKMYEDHFASLGQHKGKYLYVADGDVTNFETIVKKQGITANQWVKRKAAIGNTTKNEYVLNCDDDKFRMIIAECEFSDLPVAWTWKKPDVIITL